jgi:hypothetical protein
MGRDEDLQDLFCGPIDVWVQYGGSSIKIAAAKLSDYCDRDPGLRSTVLKLKPWFD